MDHGQSKHTSYMHYVSTCTIIISVSSESYGKTVARYTTPYLYFPPWHKERFLTWRRSVRSASVASDAYGYAH